MWVPLESPRSYTRRCGRYASQEKKIWARAIRGFTGAARTTALQQAATYDARALFAKIKEVHGGESDVQITHIVRGFIGQTKTVKVNIDDFNRTWTEQLRVLKNNDMELPPQFIINLYIIALGPRYKMLEATVAVLSPQKRTLSHVMQLAVDHTGRSWGDEADHSDMALLSEIAERSGFTLSKKRNPDGAFAAISHQGATCSICNRPYHTKEECFAPGGGMSHLSRKKRHEFLYNKRQKRTDRAPPANKPETANLVEELKAQLAEKDGKIAEQDSLMQDAKARVGGAIDLGY